MKRETIIKHMNDALLLQGEMRRDRMLRAVYSDIDLDKFIDRCREMLADDPEYWEDAAEMENPFQGVDYGICEV